MGCVDSGGFSSEVPGSTFGEAVDDCSGGLASSDRTGSWESDEGGSTF